MTEMVLSTDAAGQPLVVRVDDTVRRPAGPGTAIAEQLLVHLHDVGFDRCPRFLGYDETGRHVVSFVDGEVTAKPAWQLDDAANARQLGRLAHALHELHVATSGFTPGPDTHPHRPLPMPGCTWTHGDPGYQNIVYRHGDPHALIDWEFAAPADPLCDLAALLALSTRAPRPDVDDNDRRALAVAAAREEIAAGYGLDSTDSHRLLEGAAIVLDDAATYWTELGRSPADIANARWRADWFRAQHRSSAS